MKVLIVSSYDNKGGAAKAAYRLHKLLLKSNINSTMLVNFKLSNDPSVITVNNTKYNTFFSRIRRYIDKLPSRIFFHKQSMTANLSWLNNPRTVKIINELKPDIVHVHWFNSGFLSLSDISKINSNVVFTLHDMWLFTSGLHVDARYDVDCKFYQPCAISKCSFEYIFTYYKNYMLKKIKYLHIICLSNWMLKCLVNSETLNKKYFDVTVLPNPIDTGLFKPMVNNTFREKLGIDSSSKVILYGAMNYNSDPNKGFKYVAEALNSLNDDYVLLLYGVNDTFVSPFKQKCVTLGHVHNHNELIDIIRSSDVVVVPSLCENLSNTIVESMSCGIPVVCFDVGGNSDLVKHKFNGYLCKKLCSSELACGVDWVINNDNYHLLTSNARKFILDKFDTPLLARNYIKYYESLL